MTEKQISILKLTTVGIDIYSLSEEGQRTLIYLARDLKFCEQRELADTVFWITEQGQAALADLEEKAKQKTNESKDKRRDRRFQILNSIISALAGYLIAKIPEISSAFCSLIN